MPSNDCRYLVYPVVILLWPNQIEGVSWQESPSALLPGEKHLESGYASHEPLGPDDHPHNDESHDDGHIHEHVSNGDRDTDGGLL